MPTFQCPNGHTYFDTGNFTFCNQCVVEALNPPNEPRRTVVKMRILPRPKVFPMANEPRVKILGKDKLGFTLVEAELSPGEGVCWRCGFIAMDPNHTLEVCPHCNGDFND